MEMPEMMPMPEDLHPPSYEAVVLGRQEPHREESMQPNEPRVDYGADDMHGDIAPNPIELGNISAMGASNDFDSPSCFQYNKRSFHQWTVSIICTFFVVALWGLMLWGVAVAWTAGFDPDNPDVALFDGLGKWVGVGSFTSGFLCIGQICVAGVFCFCQIGICVFSISMMSISLIASVGMLTIGMGWHVGMLAVGTRVVAMLGIGLWDIKALLGVRIWSYHFGAAESRASVLCGNPQTS